MNIVFLNSGPRGSGKTTFTKKITSKNTRIKPVIRDNIFIEIYGSTWLCPYTDDPYIGHNATMKKVGEHLSNKTDSVVILDYFNGYSWQRREMIREIREAGADIVICLYFLIPLDTCIEWFMKKEDARGYNKHSIEWDYNLFYEKSFNIENDGFDKVIYIDPRQLCFPSIPIL